MHTAIPLDKGIRPRVFIEFTYNKPPVHCVCVMRLASIARVSLANQANTASTILLPAHIVPPTGARLLSDLVAASRAPDENMQINFPRSHARPVASWSRETEPTRKSHLPFLKDNVLNIVVSPPLPALYKTTCRL